MTAPPIPPYTAPSRLTSRTSNGTSAAAAVASETDDVPGALCPAAARMRPHFEKVAELLDGDDAVKAGVDTGGVAGTKYLPMLTGESSADYDRRLALAVFVNYFGRIIDIVAGLICQRSPRLGDDASAEGESDPAQIVQPSDELAACWESFDDAGNHAAIVFESLIENASARGLGGLLTDMPAVDPSAQLSRADAATLNLRPYSVEILGEQLCDWEHVLYGAQQVLVYLVIQEADDRRAGDFSRETVQRYRVYRRDVTRDDATGRVTHVGPPTLDIWEQASGEAKPRRVTPEPIALRKRGGKPFPRIPFRALVIGKTGAARGLFETRPPFRTVMSLNVAHYQVTAELRNVTNVGCTPTLVLNDFVPPRDEDGNEMPVAIGPVSVIRTTGANGRAGYISPGAEWAVPAKEQAESYERQIAVAGVSALFTESRAPQSATAARIDASGQNSVVAKIARRGQDCLEGAVADQAEFLDTDPVSVSVNMEFERITGDPQLGALLLNALLNDKLTAEGFYQLMEFWKITPEGFMEAELRRLASRPTPPAIAGAAPSTAGGLFDKVRADMALATTGQTPPPATNAPPAQAA